MAVVYYDFDLSSPTWNATTNMEFVSALRQILWTEVLANELDATNQYRIMIGKPVTKGSSSTVYCAASVLGSDKATGSSGRPIGFGMYRDYNVSSLASQNYSSDYFTTYCSVCDSSDYYFRFYKTDNAIYITSASSQSQRDSNQATLWMIIFKTTNNFINIQGFDVSGSIPQKYCSSFGIHLAPVSRGSNGYQQRSHFANNSVFGILAYQTNFDTNNNFMYTKGKCQLFDLDATKTNYITYLYELLSLDKVVTLDELIVGCFNSDIAINGGIISIDNKNYICCSAPPSMGNPIGYNITERNVPALFIEQGTSGGTITV